MSLKPWTLLDPNDFKSMWWRKTEILDTNICQYPKDSTDILAYYIIQDGNMGGNFWHIAEWYVNDPNRYNFICSSNMWPFNIQLIDMEPGDTIYLTESPNIKFDVYYPLFGTPRQQKYCKILERNFS